jgi:hypothetical protein
MKGGQTPIHIQRWAPADLQADEHWKLLQARRDYRTMHFYRVFMDHAFMAGGDLPADPESLAATIHMPRRDVEAALAFCLGRLVFQDGERLYQRRVRREIAEELAFREEQGKRGAIGGRVAGKGRPKGDRQATAYGDDRRPLGPPSPAPAPTPAPTPDAGGSQGNPLVPDRVALERECLALVREVAALRGVDPTEVMGEAGEWNGRRQLNPANMSDDRLLNTVLDLRRMKAGQPAHAPPANARAQERKAGMVAMIQGGLDARRSVGSGDAGSGGELPERGPGPGGAPSEGRGLPPGAGDPDR